MTAISELEIQDLLQKAEAFLSDMPLDQKKQALEDWKTTFVGYKQAHPEVDFLRLKRLIGGPRGLANTIRLKHNLPLKGSKAQSTRQAVGMILGLASLFFLVLIGIFWWKFTPIISVDNNRVQVLGGLIDIDGPLGQVKVGDSFEFSQTQYRNVFEGSYEIPDETVEDVLLEFDRGQMEITYVEANRLSWDCKISSEPSDGFISQEKELITISLKRSEGADCSFKLPLRLKYTIAGDAGKVDIIAPANDTFVQLGSGVVSIAPDSEAQYRFDLKVGQGTIDRKLEELSQDDGIEIKVDLGTGSVERKN